MKEKIKTIFQKYNVSYSEYKEQLYPNINVTIDCKEKFIHFDWYAIKKQEIQMYIEILEALNEDTL